jgi:preprotein translocase subunit SecD
MLRASHRWSAAGAGLLALLVSAQTPAAAQRRDDTPTMTNSTLEAPPEPLPADWPAAARDAQLRGAACESDYGKADARKLGAPGDDALPILGAAPGVAEAVYLGVRRTPFLARRDVVEATMAGTGTGAYEVRLELTDAGAAAVRDYTAANLGKCVALVAGGKVLWTATLDAPVEGDVFVLSGGFDSRTALAIVELFGS